MFVSHFACLPTGWRRTLEKEWTLHSVLRIYMSIDAAVFIQEIFQEGMYCGFLIRVVFMVFCEICLGLFPFNSETRTQLFYLFIKYPLWIITEYYY